MHGCRLQAGKFDAPDRLFASIADAWASVTSNPADVKELIPEFYLPNSAFLINKHNLALGRQALLCALGMCQYASRPWAYQYMHTAFCFPTNHTLRLFPPAQFPAPNRAGQRQNGRMVGDVELPPWANGAPSRFLACMRAALESPVVSANLHHWLDLIFGVKQQGQAAADADNVFHPLTYHGAVDIDKV